MHHNKINWTIIALTLVVFSCSLGFLFGFFSGPFCGQCFSSRDVVGINNVFREEHFTDGRFSVHSQMQEPFWNCEHCQRFWTASKPWISFHNVIYVKNKSGPEAPIGVSYHWNDVIVY